MNAFLHYHTQSYYSNRLCAPYSHIFNYNLPDSDAGIPNFIYVSVVTPEIQKMVEDGNYNHDVYNYDPAATEILINMQPGESKSVHQAPDMETWFTFEHKPDTQIGGYTAQTYENIRPWEFPSGTKEIRYYLSLDGCIYLFGGYVDTVKYPIYIPVESRLIQAF